MLMAHRMALDPNNVQATHLARAAGTAPFAYDWVLDEWQSNTPPDKSPMRPPCVGGSTPYARSAAIRRDALHKLTTDLTRRFHTIGIEDLGVRGLVKNRLPARSIADMGFHKLRRQLQHKAAMRGGLVVVAQRFYARSKTCSACGHKMEALALSVRSWTCAACGATHAREVNAAINLRNLAVSSTV